MNFSAEVSHVGFMHQSQELFERELPPCEHTQETSDSGHVCAYLIDYSLYSL